MQSQDQRNECNEFADRVQNLAALRLYELGYKVKQHPTNDGDNSFDILATDPTGKQLKIEVKGARLHFGTKGARYHARIHNHTADYLLMYMEQEPPDHGHLEGVGTWLVVNMLDVWPRVDLAIWSPVPTDYKGIWKDNIEAWHLLNSQ